MEENPLDQIAVLQERVAQIAADAGLQLEAFAVVPGKPGGPHFAQAIFALDPERAFKSAEDRKVDDEFKQLMMMNKISEHETAVDDIVTEKGKDLLADLENLGGRKDGIGLDDDDDSPEVPPVADVPAEPVVDEPVATDDDFDAIMRRYETDGNG